MPADPVLRDGPEGRATIWHRAIAADVRARSPNPRDDDLSQFLCSRICAGDVASQRTLPRRTAPLIGPHLQQHAASARPLGVAALAERLASAPARLRNAVCSC